MSIHLYIIAVVFFMLSGVTNHDLGVNQSTLAVPWLFQVLPPTPSGFPRPVPSWLPPTDRQCPLPPPARFPSPPFSWFPT